MHRTIGWVFLGVGIGLMVLAGALAAQRRHGEQGADCGTAYSPSELVEYRPVEMSLGCAGAFDTVKNVVITIGAAGAASAFAGVAMLVTGRLAAGAIAAASVVVVLLVLLIAVEGNPVQTEVFGLIVLALA